MLDVVGLEKSENMKFQKWGAASLFLKSVLVKIVHL